MTPREVILRNIEFQCDGRIGLNFDGGRANDFTGAGCEHDIETKTWIEGDVEFSTDIWGNTWHRLAHMSAGGEVFKPIIEDWRDLDALELPPLDNPAYFETARRLAQN